MEKSPVRSDPMLTFLNGNRPYSQTGCSFASNIAILRCNVAILMYKLLGANCNRFDKLLSKGLVTWRNFSPGWDFSPAVDVLKGGV